MASSNDVAAIQSCLANSLSDFAIGTNAIAGVIGDAPSHYSKSPALWNAAFHHLGINAVYLPFDVDDARVGQLLEVLKKSDRFLGANVTVPYKARVMDFLDELDAGARRIRAVNTIVRRADGRLIGYNTDGEGFIESILTRQPDRTESFMPSLKGRSVLLLGAGGSARAVAFQVAVLLVGGELLICNRTLDHALSLAAEIQESGHAAVAISEDQLCEHASKVDLIINSTTKGQGGARKLSGGKVTNLEFYSALAPAHAPAFTESGLATADFDHGWATAARADIESNNQASLTLAKSIPLNVRFYDLIYHPEETVFLRHGRITGHPTMNGKAMIINQAVSAFCKYICLAELQRRGSATPETHRQILDVMYHAW
jgi:shikimate dehydrogenase